MVLPAVRLNSTLKPNDMVSLGAFLVNTANVTGKGGGGVDRTYDGRSGEFHFVGC